MATLPATFVRTGESKTVGCLVYAIATPFVALFLSLFIIIPIQLTLQAWDVREDVVKCSAFPVYPVVGLVTAAWAFRDYRRRAYFQVTIRWDRVVIRSGLEVNELPFDEVMSIRLVPHSLDLACVLTRRGGKPWRISTEVAPFSVVRDALEESLIPELVRRLDRRLEAGESVAIRDEMSRSLVAIGGGSVRALSSLLLIVNPLRILIALAWFRRGVLVTRQGWLGMRSGFVLEKRGVRRLSDDQGDWVPWDSLEQVRTDEVGLTLRTRDGQTFGVSARAEDFWPALRWINARMRKGKSAVDWI